MQFCLDWQKTELLSAFISVYRDDFFSQVRCVLAAIFGDWRNRSLRCVFTIKTAARYRDLAAVSFQKLQAKLQQEHTAPNWRNRLSTVLYKQEIERMTCQYQGFQDWRWRSLYGLSRPPLDEVVAEESVAVDLLLHDVKVLSPARGADCGVTHFATVFSDEVKCVPHARVPHFEGVIHWQWRVVVDGRNTTRQHGREHHWGEKNWWESDRKIAIMTQQGLCHCIYRSLCMQCEASPLHTALQGCEKLR